MTDTPGMPRGKADLTAKPATPNAIHVFADGCYDPEAGIGGWAFVACRDVEEIAFDFGGARDLPNNAMELIALLKAAQWINCNAKSRPSIIWSDSVYAVKGCNDRRHIWKNNGWKKKSPNGGSRSRTIANAELWKAIDFQLSENHLMTIAWCKGHSGITGNERADALAESGRLMISAESTWF